MNKRLEKRHKRQVSRAKAKATVQEPDLRTPEQIRAAREASRVDTPRRSKPQHSLPGRHASQNPKQPAATGAKLEG